jgi:hypothetical protein
VEVDEVFAETKKWFVLVKKWQKSPSVAAFARMPRSSADLLSRRSVPDRKSGCGTAGGHRQTNSVMKSLVPARVPVEREKDSDSLNVCLALRAYRAGPRSNAAMTRTCQLGVSFVSRTKDRGYPRKFHQKDGQPRRVNQPLWKGDREIETFAQPMARMQSLAEALHVRALLVDRAVVGILDQPSPVEYAPGRKTFPDFEVRYDHGGVEIHEVKDVRQRGNLKLMLRTKAVARACEKLGKTYRLIFSDECYQQPKRHNVQLILRCKDHPEAQRSLEKAKAFVLNRDQTTLGELKAATGIDQLSFLALVCDGHFKIDLAKLITDETIVKP